MTKVSAIMSVYNGEKYVADTMKSVLNQSFRDFEFIIVDDGSTDKTLQIIQSLHDDRIKIIKQNHGGIVKALNAGVLSSVGQYIIRVDGDDICIPNRFEKLFYFMENNKNVVVCGSWAITINENDEVIGELTYPPEKNNEIRKYSLLHNPFIHSSVIFRKDVFEKVGGYRNYKHNEDYELWSRMLKEDEGCNIPEELIKYRIHENQVTNKSNVRMRFVGVWVRVVTLVRLLF